jgi:hypothetical protein
METDPAASLVSNGRIPGGAGEQGMGLGLLAT